MNFPDIRKKSCISNMGNVPYASYHPLCHMNRGIAADIPVSCCTRFGVREAQLSVLIHPANAGETTVIFGIRRRVPEFSNC